MQKWMIGKAKAPVGDFRDWEVIAAWAKELPGKLRLNRPVARIALRGLPFPDTINRHLVLFLTGPISFLFHSRSG